LTSYKMSSNIKGKKRERYPAADAPDKCQNVEQEITYIFQEHNGDELARGTVRGVFKRVVDLIPPVLESLLERGIKETDRWIKNSNIYAVAHNTRGAHSPEDIQPIAWSGTVECSCYIFRLINSTASRPDYTIASSEVKNHFKFGNINNNNGILFSDTMGKPTDNYVYLKFLYNFLHTTNTDIAPAVAESYELLRLYWFEAVDNTTYEKVFTTLDTIAFNRLISDDSLYNKLLLCVHSERFIQPMYSNNEVKTTPDHTIELIPVKFDGKEITCEPNRIYVLDESKKTGKSFDEAVCQTLQSSAFALDDTSCFLTNVIDKTPLFMARCLLALIVNNEGLTVLGVQTNLDNINTGNRLAVTWSPLLHVGFDEDVLMKRALQAVIMTIPDIHDAAFHLIGVHDIYPDKSCCGISNVTANNVTICENNDKNIKKLSPREIKIKAQVNGCDYEGVMPIPFPIAHPTRTKYDVEAAAKWTDGDYTIAFSSDNKRVFKLFGSWCPWCAVHDNNKGCFWTKLTNDESKRCKNTNGTVLVNRRPNVSIMKKAKYYDDGEAKLIFNNMKLTIYNKNDVKVYGHDLLDDKKLDMIPENTLAVLEYDKLPGKMYNKVQSKYKEQCVKQLKYLHEELYVIHGDVRPENIIVDDDNSRAYIIDYDFARYIDDKPAYPTTYRGKCADIWCRHDGAVAGAVMDIQHDDIALENIFSQTQNEHDYIKLKASGTPPRKK
jgi:hypothetical protein